VNKNDPFILFESKVLSDNKDYLVVVNGYRISWVISIFLIYSANWPSVFRDIKKYAPCRYRAEGNLITFTITFQVLVLP
jgi:hypothetical protein